MNEKIMPTVHGTIFKAQYIIKCFPLDNILFYFSNQAVWIIDVRHWMQDNPTYGI